ncbi:unnamed protein product [Pseudo-nitzschia multistriata]|uniref:Uncharacterized protein n=1 Tax=Pseudo-nitzschia multistriata TaxID=183589 RepID=A0A448ZLE7_9STRA|nr:unnamed protein product [Pseudo-nitzschia multistriata]
MLTPLAWAILKNSLARLAPSSSVLSSSGVENSREVNGGEKEPTAHDLPAAVHAVPAGGITKATQVPPLWSTTASNARGKIVV